MSLIPVQILLELLLPISQDFNSGFEGCVLEGRLFADSRWHLANLLDIHHVPKAVAIFLGVELTILVHLLNNLLKLKLLSHDIIRNVKRYPFLILDLHLVSGILNQVYL